VLKKLRAFGVDLTDFKKLRALEDRIKISTWYAFFEMKDSEDIFESTAYLIPLSRVEKHLPDHIRKKIQNGNDNVKWEIRIPDHCLNILRSKIDLRDQCQGCTEKYCSIFPK